MNPTRWLRCAHCWALFDRRSVWDAPSCDCERCDSCGASLVPILRLRDWLRAYLFGGN